MYLYLSHLCTTYVCHLVIQRVQPPMGYFIAAAFWQLTSQRGREATSLDWRTWRQNRSLQRSQESTSAPAPHPFLLSSFCPKESKQLLELDRQVQFGLRSTHVRDGGGRSRVFPIKGNLAQRLKARANYHHLAASIHPVRISVDFKPITMKENSCHIQFVTIGYNCHK